MVSYMEVNRKHEGKQKTFRRDETLDLKMLKDKEKRYEASFCLGRPGWCGVDRAVGVGEWVMLQGHEVLRGGGDQPASLLATREGFLWGRSCGVGMWSPVISVFSGAAAAGSCLFFILALAML